jgi:hypothetical protein
MKEPYKKGESESILASCLAANIARCWSDASPIRVITVDDHALLREGISALDQRGRR